MRGVYDAAFCLPPRDVVYETTIFGRFAVDERDIAFFNGSLSKLLRQAARRCRCACKDDDARYGTVQSVYESEEYVAGFVEFDFEIGFAHVQQVFVAGVVALYEQTSGFAYDQQVIVEVEDVHGD